MRGRIAAMVAAVTAAASAAGAAMWARRKNDAGRYARETLEPAADAALQEAEAAAEREIRGPVPGGASATPAAQASPGTPADESDDLTSLKGIGSVSAERLAEIGVTTFAQLAAWSDDDIDRNGERIRISPERIRREDWVGQARAAVDG